MNGDLLLSGQYADDTWIALKPTEQNINSALSELDNFARFSGLTINYQKSVAFKLGPLRDSDAKFYMLKPLFWTDRPIKMLGVKIHPNWDIIYQENYVKVLDKIEGILQKWTNRSLTLPGKITVVNLLIASLLVHKFLSLQSPKREFYTKYKKLICDFLWNGKKAKIRYAKLIQDYGRGGLKLVDIEAKNISLKASWLHHWESKLNDIPWLYANFPVRDSRVWYCNMMPKYVEKFMYMYPLDMGFQILYAWSKFNFSTDLTSGMYELTPLWLNSMILRANEPFQNWSLIQSNIATLSDIWNEATNKYYTFDELIKLQGNDMGFNFLVYLLDFGHDP